jgi:hypothetical protein
MACPVLPFDYSLSLHSLQSCRTFFALFSLCSLTSHSSHLYSRHSLHFSLCTLFAFLLHPCHSLVILVSLSTRSSRSLFAPLSLSCHSPLTISSRSLFSLSLLLSSHSHHSPTSSTPTTRWRVTTAPSTKTRRNSLLTRSKGFCRCRDLTLLGRTTRKKSRTVGWIQ